MLVAISVDFLFQYFDLLYDANADLLFEHVIAMVFSSLS